MSRYRAAISAVLTGLGLLIITMSSTLADGSAMEGAQTHRIRMLDTHPQKPTQRMVFWPDLLVISPGDTVTFIPSDKGHSAASIPSMIPDGARGWKGRVDQRLSVTLRTPGFYGVQSMPDKNAGMVGLIVVQGNGMMRNLSAARSAGLRGAAAQRMTTLWARLQEMGLELK